MAQVQKQIAASQQFLAGLSALPHFNTLCAGQATRLVNVISKNGLTVEEAASCLGSLKEDLWGSETLSLLKAAIAENTRNEEPGSNTRILQQDYTALPHYLEQDLWNFLELSGDENKKLERVCVLAASLGLKHPSEATCGCLVYLALFLPLNSGLLETDKYEKLQKKKPVIKKLLKHFAVSACGVEVLFAAVTECPAVLMTSAYPKGFTAGKPSGHSMMEILRSIKDYPLRSTHALARADVPMATRSPQTSTDSQMASVATAVAVGMAMAKQTLNFEQKPAVSPLDIEVFGGKKQAAGLAKPVLALEDGKVEEGEPSESFKDPEKLINDLKNDLSLEKQEGSAEDMTAGPQKQGVLRRPAASKSKAQKKPAASGSSVVKASASKKRPATSSSPSTRDALLATIPKNVKQKYRFGCTRCRGRPYCTVSCWVRRGVAIP